MMAKGSLFFRDIGYAMQLLRRDGIGEFIRRTGMYFQGQRLPSIPLPGATEFITGYSLERPCGILEFPDPGEFPLVSVIIPVYNQWEYTFSCLGSILKNSDDIHYEIILVDDNSTDETRFAGQHVNNIRIIRNVVNQGFLFNCNKAAAEAGGKFIVLLNNDTLVQPGWLIWFLKTMEEHPDAGLAGAKLIFSTGRLQEAGGIVFRDGSAMNYGREDFPDRPQYNYFKDVDYCSGAAICVRKSLWDQLGGFDARYAPAYYEDTDLAMRIRGMGYRTVYQPKSVVIHFEGVSHGTDITQGIKKKQDDNQKIFYSRWRDELLKNHYNRDENIFRSRERSINRNIALLVGYKVPDCTEFPGKDRSLQMINSFIERDYVIKFLPIDFMRNEPHVTFLEQKGVEVLYGKWYHDNLHAWINENSANIDLVCFVDKKLAKSYANLFNADLKGNLNTVVFDRNFSFRARSVNSVL